MSNPYTSVSVSSYNASAPTDDGSQTSANQLSWSKHKTKLTDPLKTAIEAINTNVLAAFAASFGNDVTAVAIDYTVTTDDQGVLLAATGSNIITLLPVATAGAVFSIIILNVGTGIITVDGDGSETINSVASIYLGPGESAILVCSGSAWNAAISRVFPSRIQTKSAAYSLAVTDIGSWFDFTAAAELTLLAATTATATFKFGIVNDGSGVVIVTPDGSETINGASVLYLHPGEQAVLDTDGSNWFALVTGDPWQTKWKTSTEQVTSSTTLQDDNELTGLVLAPDSYYEICGLLRAEANASGDMTLALSFSNTEQMVALAADGVVDGGSSSADSYTTDSTNQYCFISGGSGEIVVRIRGTFQTNATTGGTVTLQWAQGNSFGTATSVLAGSMLKVRRIG